MFTSKLYKGKINEQWLVDGDEHCSRSPAVLVTADRGGWGGADRRSLVPAFVRSSGNCPELALLAGACGEQATGAGEDEKIGELLERLECAEAASDRWRSSRRRRESGRGQLLPAVASGKRPRSRQSWKRPAGVVWSLRTSSVARDGWSCLRASFRCSPDVQAELLWLGREKAVGGSTVSRRR